MNEAAVTLRCLCSTQPPSPIEVAATVATVLERRGLHPGPTRSTEREERPSKNRTPLDRVASIRRKGIRNQARLKQDPDETDDTLAIKNGKTPTTTTAGVTAGRPRSLKKRQADKRNKGNVSMTSRILKQSRALEAANAAAHQYTMSPRRPRPASAAPSRPLPLNTVERSRRCPL